MHEGKVQRVHDQVAIVNFLKKAFNEEDSSIDNSIDNPID
jgi:hypothetical protein